MDRDHHLCENTSVLDIRLNVNQCDVNGEQKCICINGSCCVCCHVEFCIHNFQFLIIFFLSFILSLSLLLRNLLFVRTSTVHNQTSFLCIIFCEPRNFVCLCIEIFNSRHNTFFGCVLCIHVQEAFTTMNACM